MAASRRRLSLSAGRFPCSRPQPPSSSGCQTPEARCRAVAGGDLRNCYRGNVQRELAPRTCSAKSPASSNCSSKPRGNLPAPGDAPRLQPTVIKGEVITRNPRLQSKKMAFLGLAGTLSNYQSGNTRVAHDSPAGCRRRTSRAGGSDLTGRRNEGRRPPRDLNREAAETFVGFSSRGPCSRPQPRPAPVVKACGTLTALSLRSYAKPELPHRAGIRDTRRMRSPVACLNELWC